MPATRITSSCPRTWEIRATSKANWGNGFSTVLVQFAPKLRFAGVPDRMIRKILVDNPRRFLAFVPTS